ncbi:MAG: hypothetical protein J7M14_03170 [Planctomycetes bacterium]|nr:hypothetical protein [Planctomycetota bacterium]
MLRGFWVVDCCDDAGFPVVAETHREAKKLGFDAFCENGIEIEWINLRVTLIKEKIDFSKYQKGQIEQSLENLKKGVYKWLEGVSRCPRCGHNDPEKIYYDEKNYSGFYCDSCEYLEKCPECGKYNREDGEEFCEDCMNKKTKLTEVD